jgi:hypothetical protein
MTKQPVTAAPPISIVPDIAKSDDDASASEPDIPKSGFGKHRREGVTFDKAGLETHYRPIDSYEGLHRYDPSFDWEPEEERRVVRKVWDSAPFYTPSPRLAKLTTSPPRLTSEYAPGSV